MLVKDYKQQEQNTIMLVVDEKGNQHTFQKIRKTAVLNAIVIGSDIITVKTDKGLVRIEYIWID